MKKRSFNLKSILILAVVISFTACQKDPPPPEVISELKDSTLLIKSIKLNLVGNNEEVTEFYNYDSINKKVVLTWDDPTNSIYGYVESQTLTYNSKGLVSGYNIKLKPGYNFGATDIVSSSIVYDDADVLKSVIFKQQNNVTITKNYAKTSINGGYTLDWTEELDPINNDRTPILCKATFNTNGEVILNRVVFRNLYGTKNLKIQTDSTLYDANGNTKTVFRITYDSATNVTTQITLTDYLSRESIGNNLYDQRRALMNGIANIPFDNTESYFSAVFGILSIFPSEVENTAYKKFPAKAVKVYNFSKSAVETFNCTSVFDTKNRLTKFTGYFVDTNIIPEEYYITYYK